MMGISPVFGQKLCPGFPPGLVQTPTPAPSVPLDFWREGAPRRTRTGRRISANVCTTQHRPDRLPSPARLIPVATRGPGGAGHPADLPPPPGVRSLGSRSDRTAAINTADGYCSPLSRSCSRFLARRCAPAHPHRALDFCERLHHATPAGSPPLADVEKASSRRQRRKKRGNYRGNTIMRQCEITVASRLVGHSSADTLPPPDSTRSKPPA